MAIKITALAASSAKGKLEKFQFDPGALGPEHVEIAVKYCGICHSDLSMLDNDWGMTAFPFVPGHEVVGTIVEVGSQVKTLKVGQTVGLGWFSGSCLHCKQCMSGNQNLCPTAEQTIVQRHGGFADRVRCKSEWAIPLPSGVDQVGAGPLFCGGITVFNPIVISHVKPTDRVGVIGIGGLGHMAVKFLNKWGCEVVAFTTSDSKKAEAIAMGAHRTCNTRDDQQLKGLAGSLDFVISTINATINWQAIIDTLAPKGKLHLVGAVAEPIPVAAFPLIVRQKSIGGSPLGPPTTTMTMLDFCARHSISPTIEVFKMSQANEAIQHLRDGKARYRIVLENDLV